MALQLANPIAASLRIKSVFNPPSTATRIQSAGGSMLTGNGSISGIVRENGLPVSRRVMLYERTTGAYAAQVRSKADGTYIFKNTNKNLTYFIIAIDDFTDDVQYNLVGQDLISGNYDIAGGGS